MEVDRSVKEVNFTGVPVGLGVPLLWGIGSSADPTPLGTRQAKLYLHPGTPQQAVVSLAASASGLYWEWEPTGDWIGSLKYLLAGQLLDGGPFVPLVQGSITIGVVVKP